MLAAMTTADPLSETVELLARTHQLGGETLAQGLRSTMMPTLPESDGQAQRALDALVAGAQEQAQPLSLDSTLGEGGMGVVHLGTQHALGRKVAIKTLRAEANDERSRLKLLREAWVTAALEHPNILPVHDLRLDGDGAPMVVLKRIEGVTWEELMFEPALQARYLSRARRWSTTAVSS